MSRRAALALLLLMALPQSARAQESASAFIARTAERTFAVLDAAAAPAEIRAALAGIVEQSFALAAIAGAILGDVWAAADAKDRAAFLLALRRVVVAETILRFADYRPGSFAIAGSRAVAPGEHIVGTRFQRKGGERREMQWRVAARNGGWVILDVFENGASMRLVKRDEYAAILRRPQATLATLIERMNLQAEGLERGR
ncbi:MAG: ABC transporter substrate-binding protein [Rhodospirillaceae bacterium]|nr:ABC transporter substrate-binding protein [Rhodospirillaceae bacterium]